MMIRRLSEQSYDETRPSRDAAPDQIFAPGEPFPVRKIWPAGLNPRGRQRPGRRGQTLAAQTGGYYVRATRPTGPVRDIALAATLRAAALRLARAHADENVGQVTNLSPTAETVGQVTNLSLTGSDNGQDAILSYLVSPDDLRVKVRRKRTGNLILFVVDASGSMGARKRMAAVKGAVLSLLLEAYQKRDRVGLIAFRGEGAQLLAPPTNSVELAERHLRQMPTGGRTPLAAGLQLAGQVLRQYLWREAALAPLLVLVTDGRANAGPPAAEAAHDLRQAHLASLVLDSEQGFVRLGLARELAAWLGAEYLLLDELHAQAITRHIRPRLKG